MRDCTTIWNAFIACVRRWIPYLARKQTSNWINRLIHKQKFKAKKKKAKNFFSTQLLFLCFPSSIVPFSLFGYQSAIDNTIEKLK